MDTWGQHGAGIYLCIQSESHWNAGAGSGNGRGNANHAHIWGSDGRWDFPFDEKDGNLEWRGKIGKKTNHFAKTGRCLLLKCQCWRGIHSKCGAWRKTEKDEIIGQIVDPLCGKVLDEVRTPEDGMLFTIRDYPVVVEGSLMGRLLKKEVCGYE